MKSLREEGIEELKKSKVAGAEPAEHAAHTTAHTLCAEVY